MRQFQGIRFGPCRTPNQPKRPLQLQIHNISDIVNTWKFFVALCDPRICLHSILPFGDDQILQYFASYGGSGKYCNITNIEIFFHMVKIKILQNSKYCNIWRWSKYCNICVHMVALTELAKMLKFVVSALAIVSSVFSQVESELEKISVHHLFRSSAR